MGKKRKREQPAVSEEAKRPASSDCLKDRYGSVVMRMMENQGWKRGKGLGAQGQGRCEAIKPPLKFDVSGLGHDPGREFTSHWWDVAFNRAAGRIKVHHDQDDDEVKVTSEERPSKKQKRREQRKAKANLYGGFVKSATLEDGVEKKGATDSPADSSDEEEERLAKTKVLSRLTDEELFHACGGMTAHKGARHGHRMSGKEARVKAMDDQLLNASEAGKDQKVPHLKDQSKNLKKKKKKKKEAQTRA